MKNIFKNLATVNDDIKVFKKNHPVAYVFIYLCWYVGYVAILSKAVDTAIDYALKPAKKQAEEIHNVADGIDPKYGEQ
jgi:hypothetical protein